MSGARSILGRLCRIVVGTCLVGQLLGPSTAAAQSPAWDPEAPWPRETVATLRSFFERSHVDEVMVGLRMPPAEAPVGDPVRIRAAELGDSPEALLRFVQQGIAHHAYAGSVLGARGTLLARRGNALDRSLLLVALARSAGRRARLVRGRLRWEDAVRLAGPQPTQLEPGDPWLRRVELAADHWWVEMDGPGGWTAMDPSFPGAASGSVPGARREIHDEPPRDLVAMARLVLLDEGRELLRYEMPAADLVGTGVIVTAERLPAVGTVQEPSPETAAVAVNDAPAGKVSTADRSGLDALDLALAEARLPPDAVRVRAGARDETVPVTAAASGLELRMRVQPPLDQPLDVAVSFRPGRGTSVAIVLESGSVDVGASVLPVYRTLQALAEQELTALIAYRERPEELEEGGEDMAAVTARAVLAAELPIDGDAELHPARALHLAALRAWDCLGAALPGALGRLLLAAGERLQPGAAVERAPLRMAAVRWRPPTEDEAGEATVWAADGIELDALPVPARRRAGTAFGFLHSAIVGQVLHRIADAAPLTAFDLTLRSVGTGQRLVWLDTDTPLPDAWPAAALRVARQDRRLGRLLVGPRMGSDVTGAPGWWAVDPVSGGTEGRVVHGGEVATAAVTIGEAGSAGDLEAMLAGLPALHGAARWLVQAADPRSGALEALLPGACAATTLVSDLLSAGAPPDLELPAFGAFCGGGPGATGRR